MRDAAQRTTTTLSERNLRRISSDLHDGPGQMLALAMLRLERLQAKPTAEAEYDELQSALTDALRDMRSIAAGLRLPELESLSTADTVRRVVDDHVRHSGTQVTLDIDETRLPRRAAADQDRALPRAAGAAVERHPARRGRATSASG